MIAQVLLLNGFEKSLSYNIPDSLKAVVQPGSVVRVPLQRRFEAALVLDVFQTPATPQAFKMRALEGLETFPADPAYHSFIQKVSRFYLVPPIHFYQRIRHFLKEQDQEPDVLPTHTYHERADGIVLTDEQQAIVDFVSPFIGASMYQPTLIHGVTGSGKTEVYKRLIKTAIAANKSVVLLLPEVTLALQFQVLLGQQLPDICVMGFHSATKISEKRMLWDRACQGAPTLIIGVHLPALLPLANLGLIIIDEEHEQGFCEKKHPKINSKQIALMRAHYYKIPIVLGSATPSLNSLYNVEHHGWKLFSITKRFAGAFPTVQKVLLTDKRQRRRRVFWVSHELEAAIHDRLAKKEQIIIFINRRGYSFFVQCSGCGFIFQCPSCAVSLTLHLPNILRCHYCDHAKPLPAGCPECKAPEKELIKKGIGTQQVVTLFQELFPTAVIARADLDSATKKRAWQKTVEQFSAGEIDILIGTQTITKGYHFPNVTLVGVLWADLNLHFPLYNASELTLQQLIQVAGRAGRQRAGGHVIVQTMHDHPVYEFLDEQRYLRFCASEMPMREESFYPPFARLVTIELKHHDSVQIDADAAVVATALRGAVPADCETVRVLGPAYPLIARMHNLEVRHILIKAATHQQLHGVLSGLDGVRVQSKIFLTFG